MKITALTTFICSMLLCIPAADLQSMQSKKTPEQNSEFSYKSSIALNMDLGDFKGVEVLIKTGKNWNHVATATKTKEKLSVVGYALRLYETKKLNFKQICAWIDNLTTWGAQLEAAVMCNWGDEISALGKAIILEDIPLIDHLLLRGADIEHVRTDKDENTYTGAHQAIVMENMSVIRHIIGKSASVNRAINFRRGGYESGMSVAMNRERHSQNCPILTLLLEHGGTLGTIMEHREYKISALEYAATYMGPLSLLKCVIHEGADLSDLNDTIKICRNPSIKSYLQTIKEYVTYKCIEMPWPKDVNYFCLAALQENIEDMERFFISQDYEKYRDQESKVLCTLKRLKKNRALTEFVWPNDRVTRNKLQQISTNKKCPSLVFFVWNK